MIEIKDKKDCCGCNACGDICPKTAICFEKDSEGFLYPVVDRSKCVECGLCEKTCPQLHHATLRQNEFAEPKCFAVAHKNLATLFDSTSGGAFSALANVIYRRGGFVGGAIWNDDFSIRQYVSDDKDDLPKLRSSKYAQSDARGFYAAVKAAVETGRPVLVCGCPCQMFALRAYLGRTYDNLYIIDFICRGNNSPLVFRKYLDWQESRNGGKAVYVKPKNKELGWRNLTTKIVFDNGKTVYDTRDTSYFTKGYLSTNVYCRPSCYHCQFKGLPRVSDITVADFWGANDLELPKELDRDLGTSLVMLNNSRGEALFGEVSRSMHVFNLSWEQAQRGNVMWKSSLPPPNCNRDEFFQILNEHGFEAVARRFISPPNISFFRFSLLDVLRRTCRVLRRGLSCAYMDVCDFMRSPRTFMLNVRLNGIKRVIARRPLVVVSPGTVVENAGMIEVRSGTLRIGKAMFYDREIHPSAIGIMHDGKMVVKGNVHFAPGADVEVFRDATLELGDGCGFNIGATIVCGERITLGKHVMCGRHVTIRDNNGGHWMNLPGYRDTKPVEIGEHAWLCEGCTIMPGVKIGAGAVIGAKAVVFNNVPANTLVMGNPAQVVCDKVEWKY